MHNAGMKNAKIEVRCSPDQKAIVEAAARTQGLSIASFVLSVALKAAGAFTLGKTTLKEKR